MATGNLKSGSRSYGLSFASSAASSKRSKSASSKTVVGTNGNDRLIGKEKTNYLWGEGGNDIILGAAGDDVLVGGAGTDILLGGAGQDILIGGQVLGSVGGSNGRTNIVDAAPDVLFGGGGRDSFVVGRGPGYSLIQDFRSGEDRIVLTAGMQLDNVRLLQQKGGTVLIHGNDILGLLKGVKTTQIAATDFTFV